MIMPYLNVTNRNLYFHGVTVNVPSYDLFDGTEDKIKSFAQLARGWDYGNGGPIPEGTLRKARAWNTLLKEVGFSETDAFPGGGYEVVVAGSIGEHYVEIIVEPSDRISIAYDHKGRQQFYKANLSESEAEQAMGSLVRGLWSASDYFTRISTTQNNISSPELLFATWTVDYRSLSGTAFNNLEILSEPTSGSTINAFPELWANHLYSGNLTQTPFQPDTLFSRSRLIRGMLATTT
jgi:hypothetical protein